MKKFGNLIVVIIALLCAGSSVAYLIGGDWKRSIYWACVSIINVVSIYL
jgi:hypothetical protein